MRIVVTRQLADLPVSRAQWNALVSESVDATVFQTYEWFECWWNAFGASYQLHLVTLWDGAVLAGVAPLMIVRRFGLRRLEFVGTPNADYQDFILGKRAEQLLPVLARHLSDGRGDWDMLVLRNVPTESLTYLSLPALLRSLGLGTLDVERIPCPTLEVSSRATEVRRWLERYSLRRRLKQLGRNGEIRFRRCLTQAEIDHYLPLFFDQYIERRRGTAAAEAFGRPEARGFFTALSNSLRPAGWLHFSVLECGDRPVAFHLGFEFKDRLYWYKPSFDLQMARHSPGKVLLSFLIRDALDRNLREVDFTVGAEAFKARYTRKSRTNANVRIFSKRWLHLAARSAVWVWDRLAPLRRVSPRA